MSGPAVFAYGSLVSRASIAETLGREADRPRVARLTGWRRRWSLVRDNALAEKGFAPVAGAEFDFCLGLNLEPSPGRQPAEWPNGALVAVSEAELHRLDRRELRYRRVEVTADVAGAEHGFDAVFAYTARPEHHATAPPPRSVLIAAYLRAVEAAFAELGPGQLDAFRATTAPVPAPVVEARLVRDRIPSGNPRAW